MTEVILALGSNLGDRAGQIQEALDRLASSGLKCEAISSCYESKAVGLKDQPDFVNVAGKFTCQKCSPFEVLRLISSIESEMGRVRTVEKGPRMIDIDLIFENKNFELNLIKIYVCRMCKAEVALTKTKLYIECQEKTRKIYML